MFFAAVPLRSVRPVIRKAKLQIVAHSGAPAPAAPFLPRYFNVGRWRAPELGLRRGSSGLLCRTSFAFYFLLFLLRLSYGPLSTEQPRFSPAGA